MSTPPLHVRGSASVYVCVCVCIIEQSMFINLRKINRGRANTLTNRAFAAHTTTSNAHHALTPATLRLPLRRSLARIQKALQPSNLNELIVALLLHLLMLYIHAVAEVLNDRLEIFDLFAHQADNLGMAGLECVDLDA